MQTLNHSLFLFLTMITQRKKKKKNNNKNLFPLKRPFWFRVIFFLIGSALVDLAWSLVFHSLRFCRTMSLF